MWRLTTPVLGNISFNQVLLGVLDKATNVTISVLSFCLYHFHIQHLNNKKQRTFQGLQNHIAFEIKLRQKSDSQLSRVNPRYVQQLSDLQLYFN